MMYEVNECCDCAAPGYPCLGNACEMRHQTRYECDRCGTDDLTEYEIHHVDGEDLCDECFEEEERKEKCDECREEGNDFYYDEEGQQCCRCDECDNCI